MHQRHRARRRRVLRPGRPRRSPRRLLATQHADGGWNCWDEDPATPGRPSTPRSARWRGCWAWEQATGGIRRGRAPRGSAGEEYLLERGLFRRRSTGEVADPRMTMLSSPVRWFYDILRGLEYFRLARPDRDDRAAPRRSSCCGRSGCRWGCSRSRTTHQGPTLFEPGGRGRGVPEPLGHAARAAGAAVVGRRLSARRRTHGERPATRGDRALGGCGIRRSLAVRSRREPPPTRGGRRRAPARGRP